MSTEPPKSPDPKPPNSAEVDHWLTQLYDELRQQAEQSLRREQGPITISATALVHEAYLRLSAGAPQSFHDRSHFLAIAARTMRRVLVDTARARHRLKRGGDTRPITLTEEVAWSRKPMDVLEVDDALQRLDLLHERHARVVELRVFGQMTFEEMAPVLGVSVRTLKEDWKMARLWLLRELDTDLNRQPGDNHGKSSTP